jgi:hypothetical protein
MNDVITWSVAETQSNTQRLVASFGAQGRRFAEQQKLWDKAGEDLANLDQNLAKRFLEEGGKGLRSRYGPDEDGVRDEAQELSPNKLINEINERCREFRVEEQRIDVWDEEEENEQEKEGEREQQLAPELEQQASTQRPPPAQPIQHAVSTNLENFVKDGKIPKGHPGFKWAFEIFLDSNLRSFIPKTWPPSGLRVTNDFARTIQSQAAQDGDNTSDDFQRSVQWVLLGGPSDKVAARHMVVISPYEASQLMTEIEKSKCVSLHLYAPRQNQASPPLDNLELYTITRRPSQRKFMVPRQLQIELNIFSGQLYFKDYQEYVDTCHFLGLASPETQRDSPGIDIESDGFINIIGDAVKDGSPCRFHKSPVKEIKDLMSKIRRNCGSIDKTHMGRVLNGQMLHKDEFDWRGKRSADDISED